MINDIKPVTSKEHFKRWFVETLGPLKENGQAGFVFLFVTFPLLERYLRKRSGCADQPRLDERFYTQLGVLFPILNEGDLTKEFWECYRHGLLHQGTFKITEDGNPAISGYDPRPVNSKAGTPPQFFVNPVAFFEHVTGAILADFETYEGTETSRYPLALPIADATGPQTLVPTINVFLPSAVSLAKPKG